MDGSVYKRLFSSLILIPLTFFFIIKGSFFFLFFLFLCFVLSLKEWKNMSYEIRYFYPGVIFLLFSFISAFCLRILEDKGLIFFIYVLLISIFSDLGGYVIGRLLKGPKLIKISPNKTYSGVLGAYIFSILSIYFYLIILNKYFNQNEFFNIKTIILVLIVSTISQIGDLIISYFKRKFNIKDTGNLIPGHGGLLDRIDGLIFALPFYYILILLNII